MTCHRLAVREAQLRLNFTARRRQAMHEKGRDFRPARFRFRHEVCGQNTVQ